MLTDEHDPEHSDYPNRDNLVRALEDLQVRGINAR